MFVALGSNYADETYVIKQTSTGHLIAAGGYERDGFDTAEVLVVKMTMEGDTLWTRTYGSEIDTSHVSPGQFRHLSGGNIGYDIHEREDGSFLIAGVAHFFGEGMGDSYVLNIDPDGNLLWSSSYGGSEADIFFSLLPMPNGGYILGGLSESFGVTTRGGFCVRINSVGDTLWTKVVSDEFISEYRSLAFASDEGFLAGGTTFNGIDESADIRVTKFSMDGELIWEKTIGGSLNEFCSKIIPTADDGYLVLGTTESFGSGGRDAYCVKLDIDGEVEWSKSYGGSNFDEFTDGIIAEDGNYILIGYTSSFGAGNDDVLLVKTNEVGEVIWAQTYGGDLYDYGQSVLEEEGGSLLLTGYGSSFDQAVDDWFVDNDVYMIRTSSDGSTICHNEMITLSAADCATVQNVSVPVFASGALVHDPPTLTGSTFSELWDACLVSNQIDDKNSIQELLIYPQPCSSQVTVAWSEAYRDARLIRITDMRGRVVLERNFPSGVSTDILEVGGFVSGMYMINVLGQDYSLQSKMLVE